MDIKSFLQIVGSAAILAIIIIGLYYMLKPKPSSFINMNSTKTSTMPIDRHNDHVITHLKL